MTLASQENPKPSSFSGQGAEKKSPSSLSIHWFRNRDLRLHDNPSLTAALDHAAASKNNEKNEGGAFLPIYCFDPSLFGNQALSEFHSLKCGPRRAKFLLESVQNLRENLEQMGSGLVVAYGAPEEILGRLVRNCASSNGKQQKPKMKVFCQEEVASEELKSEAQVKSAIGTHGASLQRTWGSTMYNLDDLPFYGGLEGMPDVFTPFRNKVEKKCDIGKPLRTPSKALLSIDASLVASLLDGVEKCSLTYMPTLQELGYNAKDIQKAEFVDERGVMEFKGGETVALARVRSYIWEKDLLKVYFDTRNGMIGPDYSTKFAPWLAHGCLSPRHVAAECAKYEQKRVANKSTYWVVFELLWRDFFVFFAAKHGNLIFQIDGTGGKKRRWGFDKRKLQMWKDGMTGYPLVDANMRELTASGFMSNRGRQNVCSFLAHDMNTDWRYGADFFEQELLDYDVYSNWGNWCAGAGMTGGRINRFNIVKQSKDYDVDGDYVKHWLPELKNVPPELVHEPWKMTPEQQETYGVRLGVDYPRPIVSPYGYKPKNKSQNGQGGNGNDTKKGGRRENGPRRKRDPDVGAGGKKRGEKGWQKEMKSLKQGTYRMT